MNATGPNDVALSGDNLYVLMGFGGDPATRVDVNAGADQFGYLLAVDDGQVSPVDRRVQLSKRRTTRTRA